MGKTMAEMFKKTLSKNADHKMGAVEQILPSYFKPRSSTTPVEIEVPRDRDYLKNRIQEGHEMFQQKYKAEKNLVTNVQRAEEVKDGCASFHVTNQFRKISELETELLKSQSDYVELIEKWRSSKDAEQREKNHEELRRILAERKAECDSILDCKNELISKYKRNLKERCKELQKDWVMKRRDLSLLESRLRDLIAQISDVSQKETDSVRDLLIAQKKKMMLLAKKESKKKSEAVENEMSGDFDNMPQPHLNEIDRIHSEGIIRLEKIQPLRIKIAEEVRKFNLMSAQEDTRMHNSMMKLKHGQHLLSMQIKEHKFLRNEMVRRKIRYTDKQSELKKELKKIESKLDPKLIEKQEEVRKDIITRRIARYQSMHKDNRTRFHVVYKMMYGEFRRNLENFLELDRTIHEDMLKVKWSVPELPIVVEERAVVTPEIERIRGLMDEFLRSRTPSSTATEEEIDSNGSFTAKHQALQSTAEEYDREEIVDPDGNFVASLQTLGAADEEIDSNSSFIVRKPLNMKDFILFVLDSIDVLINVDIKNFLSEYSTDVVNLITANSSLPAAGINTIEDLEIFAAYVIDRSLRGETSVLGQLSRSDVLKALKDWREFQLRWDSEMKKEATRESKPKESDRDHHHHTRLLTWNVKETLCTVSKRHFYDYLSRVFLKYYSTLKLREKLLKKLRKEITFAEQMSRCTGVTLPAKVQKFAQVL